MPNKLFAATTLRPGGWQYSVALAPFFTFGMMLPDAVNGLWLLKLISQANTHAQTISRVMSGVIAALSLTIGMINLIQLAFPPFAARVEEWQLLISATVILVATIGFQAVLYFRQRRPGRSSSA